MKNEYHIIYYINNREKILNRVKEYNKNKSTDINNCGLYRLIAPDGTTYFGSSYNLAHRRNTHFYDIRKHRKTNPVLNRLSYLYDVKNFKFEILALCAEEDLVYYENILINKCDCCNIKKAKNNRKRRISKK